MALPRYLASASADEEFAAWHASALIGPETAGPVCVVQCGTPSAAVEAATRALERFGRRVRPVVVETRDAARSDPPIAALSECVAAWIVADNLLVNFLLLFATPLAFALRSRARKGLPTIGTGGGAVSLGGLVLARRICNESRFDLVSGLGWAPRVLLDAELSADSESQSVLSASVHALPQLLALALGKSGAVRVEGGQVDSVGAEPVSLFGMDDEKGGLRQLIVPPGSRATIAPPPFPPFESGLLSPDVARVLRPAVLTPRAKAAPPATVSIRDGTTGVDAPGQPMDQPSGGEATPSIGQPPADSHAVPHDGDPCPLCSKIHVSGDFVEAAA